MRFQRHAKIFRGQLDPAPVAGVFFLLIIFVVLGSLLYTPGVLVELKDDGAITESTIVVKSNGTNIVFAGKTYQTNELAQLRAEIQNLPPTELLTIFMEPGAPSKLRDQLNELLYIDPPKMTAGLVGTDNPVVIVAVNLRGQYFYENRMVQEPELRKLLQERLKEASQASKNLTLVLLQDNGVPAKSFVHISSLAKKVGIKEILIQTRPGPFSKAAISPVP